MALSLKSHFSELSLESNAFVFFGIRVLAYIWLRFSRKVVGCMGPFAWGASKNVAGACLSQHFHQVNLAIRSTEAENQTKMLFEIACQNFFRDRCRPDPQNHIGSVAGLGGFSPTGDPATEPIRLNWGPLSEALMIISKITGKKKHSLSNPTSNFS